jgi:outer membrane protein assembly factor BamB
MTIRSAWLFTAWTILLLSSLAARGADEQSAPPSAGLHLGTLPVNKVLFLGNSITLHPPAEQIGWTGNWGMAASAAEKDYVHLLVARLKDVAGGEPQTLVKNLADFERQYATYDLAVGLRDALDFQADVVIIALGENVPALATPAEQQAYRLAFVRLLNALRQNNRPTIFVRNTFWSEPVRNELMRQACLETGDAFVELKDLDKNEANFARSERDFQHAGVAGHPGDRGMRAIANGLWKALERHASAGNWPEFRGPTADGHAQTRGLPLTWNETTNVVWKTPIHDYGWSSPVIWQNQVWVTTAKEDGTQLFAVCVDCDSGKIVHDVKVFDVEKPEHVASVNSYASPTSAIEAGRVYVHFGTYGTACLDTASGQVLWTRRDLNCDHHEGPGSSPILYRDLLIVHVDGRDVQYVIALDKTTGKTAWKTTRSIDYSQFPENCRKAFCTPTVVNTGTRDELISPAAKAVFGYDPRTGQELWKIRHDGWSMVPRPMVGRGLAYFVNDFERPELWAIRPGGDGDVTDTHIAWKIRQGVSNQPSMLFIDQYLYMVADGGVLSCLDATSGDVVWKQRLEGSYAASPLYSDGRIYLFGQDAKTTVVEPGAECKILAENQLDGELKATPAAADCALLIRTRTHLYKIHGNDE